MGAQRVYYGIFIHIAGGQPSASLTAAHGFAAYRVNSEYYFIANTPMEPP
jgi:hypothetical protein